MIEVVVAPQARDDLVSIVTYLAAVASPATARRWNDRLWAAIQGLSEFPGTGTPRPRLGAHIRIAVVRPSVVVYEYHRGTARLDVLRVVHGRRQITRKLVAGRGAMLD